jgi:hypothetical protein
MDRLQSRIKRRKDARIFGSGTASPPVSVKEIPLA